MQIVDARWCILCPGFLVLLQEGICMTLKPEFHFLEVAYPYVAR
jgi:predicted unusual protein kinase regulating ubiquinone biosynthesis (AarF/ABC1/UbiB family)